MNNGYATHTPFALGAALLPVRSIMSFHPIQASDGGAITVSKSPSVFVAMPTFTERLANGHGVNSMKSTAHNGRGSNG